MPQIRTIQSRFTAGEISPRMLARTDLESYENALKTMVNATSLTHGGARKRAGSVYIDAVKNAARPTRLIPFVYSRNDSFVIIFNDGVIRFLKEGQYIKVGLSSVIYELAHSFTDDEISDLTYAQNGNILYIASRNHEPMELIRDADDNWTITPLVFEYEAFADFTFDNGYISFRITTAADGFEIGDVITITTDGSGGIASGPTFVPIEDGRRGIAAIAVNNDLDPGEVWTITCFDSTTNRQRFTVVGSITGTPTAQWYPGNYPGAVSFYEQRLYYSGSTAFPQRIWGSTIGADLIFTLGPDDSDGVQFDMASNRFSQVLHLESARTLLPLAFGSEFSISGTSNGGITPTGVNIREQSFYGSSVIKPIRIGQEVLFIQRDRKKVRAISYDIAIDSNVAPDLTIISEHITSSGVVDMTYQQDPDSIAWLVRDDGVMLSLTHLREQALTAWARHITDGKYKAIASIPEKQSDIVYSVVERVVDGNTVQYIEQFKQGVNVDSALEITLSGSPLDLTISGFEHLEGKLISILADGKVHPSKTVIGGSFKLDYPATKVIAGLPYTMTLELLHPDVNVQAGTSQGAQTSISSAVVRVQDTIGIEINEQTIAAFKGGDLLDTEPVLFTGDININMIGWNSPLNLKIEQKLPLPATILGVILKLNINEL